MSAFLCTAATFDAIASYAALHRIEIQLPHPLNERPEIRQFLPEMARLAFWRFSAITFREAIARILHAENVRSINARYPDTEDNNDMGTASEYTPRHVVKNLSHAQVLGAIRCYTYQSCESSDWEQTVAYAICETIERHAISALADTEGTWPVAEELVRPAGQAVGISLFEMANKRKNGGR